MRNKTEDKEAWRWRTRLKAKKPEVEDTTEDEEAWRWRTRLNVKNPEGEGRRLNVKNPEGEGQDWRQRSLKVWEEVWRRRSLIKIGEKNCQKFGEGCRVADKLVLRPLRNPTKKFCQGCCSRVLMKTDDGNRKEKYLIKVFTCKMMKNDKWRTSKKLYQGCYERRLVKKTKRKK